jgi:phage shock protein E
MYVRFLSDHVKRRQFSPLWRRDGRASVQYVPETKEKRLINQRAMFDTLKEFLGLKSVDYASLVKGGAVIIDVRTKGEYAAGHIRGSVNIPVDKLSQNLARFPDKERTIITCCASGMRSGSARTILKANGFQNVINGGSWISLHSKL